MRAEVRTGVFVVGAHSKEWWKCCIPCLVYTCQNLLNFALSSLHLPKFKIFLHSLPSGLFYLCLICVCAHSTPVEFALPFHLYMVPVIKLRSTGLCKCCGLSHLTCP